MIKKAAKPKLLLLSSELDYHNNPTQIFEQLCGNRSATMLLESAEINSQAGLKSLLIVDSALRISAKDQVVTIVALSINGASLLSLLDQALPESIHNEIQDNTRILTIPSPSFPSDNVIDLHLQITVFDVLRSLIKLVDASHENEEALFIGGLFAYDLINSFESLPKVERKNHCPDYCFYLAETLLISDHKNKTQRLQASLFTPNIHEQQRLVQRLVELKRLLQHLPELEPLRPFPQLDDSIFNIPCDHSDEAFAANVEQLQSYIHKGEIFQVVPSRTYTLPCPDPLNAYQILKKRNPSPYMFYIQDSDFILFGASPESALKYSSETRQVELYPIAGTRPRGLNPDGSVNADLDNCIELEMRTDHKELAEHIMLVDLARNDIARICEAGSRHVTDLTQVDRYSQVMHLVSKVVGTLKPELDALHAYQACMNMGTLSGAPKLRAMELICQTEKRARGAYGGAVGYFTAHGNFDTCIVIRCAYIEDQMAHVQAGAGVVLHSNPVLEARETQIKIQAVISSIILAHQL